MLLNIQKSGEQDLEHSEEWLVNTDPERLVQKLVTITTELETRSN